MDIKQYSPNLTDEPVPIFTIGSRLTMWIVLVFAVVLTVFVVLDLLHESRFAAELGATQQQVAEMWIRTAWLHLVHLAVTVVAFAFAIQFIVRHLLIRRIKKIVQAVIHLRRGIWSVHLPNESGDELDWVIRVIRELGPDLESKLTTFVEVDRRATIARLNALYEERLEPLAQSIIHKMRAAKTDGENEQLRAETEQSAMRIIAELGLLGRPEHPHMSGIVKLHKGELLFKQVGSGTVAGVRDNHGEKAAQ